MLFPYDIFNRVPSPPFHMDENGILYNNDCLEILKFIPANSIDMIVTDPPYGINYRGCNLIKNKKSKTNLIKNDTPSKAILLFENFIIEAKRVLKKGGVCICCAGNGGSRNVFSKWIPIMEKYLHYKQTVIWEKCNLGLGYHYRPSTEMILIANNKGHKCKWNGGYKTSNIIKINKINRSKYDHPTPKPVDLMAQFVRLHSNANDIILDPFAGHGPTLVAAKSLKRRFLGIELEKKYCNVIAQSLLEN